MDDLISRQAAIDAIDEISREVDDGDGFDYAKWREYFCELPSAEPERTPMQELLDVTADRDYWKSQCHSYEMTINRLTESAQPEIIRCKDCKYARLTNDGSCKYCDIWFPDEAEYMDGDYYCASAERKSSG